MVESLLLVCSLCIDTFVTSIAYGTNKIKIPFSSAIIINGTCSLFLAISLFIGSILKDFLNPSISTSISFCLLFLLGVYRLFESFLKDIFRDF